MINEVTPQKVQEIVKTGFDRMRTYRRARAMFVRAYVGQYYSKIFGQTGEQPINLLFSAIRSIVPTIVSRNPRNSVTTDNLQYKEYAEMQSMALDKIALRVNLKAVLRAWVVSAMFSMGIIKTGISANGNCILIDNQLIDPGDIYVSLVDLDDFVIDPLCKSITESSFLGNRTPVPRKFLLDQDLYDHDLVMKLPSATALSGSKRATAEISQQHGGVFTMRDLQDLVNVVELWIPDANALVTIPDPREITFPKYLGITDYYGPDTGPYRFLSFTPPVDSNPLPVAPVSLYYDLHKASNRTFTKILDQAENQKDILLYKPSHADVAQDILDVNDQNSAVATDLPDAAKVVSFGGQNQNNVQMLQQLQVWFNYMSGNPDQLAGVKSDAATATQATILQSNAMISVEDARDLLYDGTAGVSHDCAWYMHHDPMLDMVLARRKPGMEAEQIILTPEQRKGDVEDFLYKIVSKSMTRLDPALRSKRLMEFLTNAIPAMANSAMIMMQIGMPYNLQRAILMAANELEIGDEMQEVFEDPEFQQKLQMYLMLHQGGGGAGVGGTPGSTRKAGPMSSQGIAQNHGSPMRRDITGPGQDANAAAQGGAPQANQGIY